MRKKVFMFQSFDLCDFEGEMLDELLMCFVLSILAIFE